MLPMILSLIALSLMIILHEFGHLLAAKRCGIRVEEFGLGYPPRLFTIATRGGTRYTINAIPFGGFVRLAGEDDPHVPGGLASKGKLVRFFALVAGPLMNFVLAIALFTLAFMAGWPEATEFKNVMIAGVAKGSPAERAGLKVGDLILQAGDRPIESPQDLLDYVSAHLGQRILLRVGRGEKTMEVPVVPREHPPEGEGPMGVLIERMPSKVSLRRYPFGAALLRGFQQTVVVAFLTLAIPVLMLRGLLPGARPSGPVGMFQMVASAARQSVATGWWFPVLQLTALLSTGLAVANLLPLPALDGGRIFFIIVEAIRGRRVDPRKESAIHLVGMAILIGLMLLITFYDIISPVPIMDWTRLLR